jgi:hypothetical protein
MATLCTNRIGVPPSIDEILYEAVLLLQIHLGVVISLGFLLLIVLLVLYLYM